MQGHDARILRGAAIPTAGVGIAATLVAAVTTGVQGLLGAALGTTIVLAFFGVSFFVITWAGNKKPQSMYPAAIGTYLAKTVALGVALILFGDATVFDGYAFAVTTLLCITIWTGAHMWALNTTKMLYVEPFEESR